MSRKNITQIKNVDLWADTQILRCNIELDVHVTHALAFGLWSTAGVRPACEEERNGLIEKSMFPFTNIR